MTEPLTPEELIEAGRITGYDLEKMIGAKAQNLFRGLFATIATLTAERDALKAAIRRYSEEIGCGCEPGNGYYTPEGVREWLDEPVVCILCASLRGDA